jgi:hypothetical protein
MNNDSQHTVTRSTHEQNSNFEIEIESKDFRRGSGASAEAES